MGDWLVTEHVHEPDGTFVGNVYQRRTLDPRDNGTIRVTQSCVPDGAVRAHAMGRFEGEWVFDLVVEGSRRRYRGPDVIGTGIEWSPGAMTGRGVWPRLGHSFRSWAVLSEPHRQVTGGWFSVAGRPVAAIVGVAVPADSSADGAHPRLDLDAVAPGTHGVTGLEYRVGPMTVVEHWVDPAHRRWALEVIDHERVSGLVLDDVDGVLTGRGYVR